VAINDNGWVVATESLIGMTTLILVLSVFRRMAAACWPYCLRELR
jgi:hypothetical protein